MSNYRRLISYIYAYEGGVKGKNIGFAKIETRGIQCKITVNVKRVYVGGNDIGVYLLAGEQEIYLGNIFIRGGSGEFRAAVSASDIEHSGIAVDQCFGLTIHDVKNTWRSYTTIWEDAVAHAAELELQKASQANHDDDRPAISEEQIKKAVQEIEEEFPLQSNEASENQETSQQYAEEGVREENLVASLESDAKKDILDDAITKGAFAEADPLESLLDAQQQGTMPGMTGPGATGPSPIPPGEPIPTLTGPMNITRPTPTGPTPNTSPVFIGPIPGTNPRTTGPTVPGPTITGPTVPGSTITGPTVPGPTITGPTAGWKEGTPPVNTGPIPGWWQQPAPSSTGPMPGVPQPNRPGATGQVEAEALPAEAISYEESVSPGKTLLYRSDAPLKEELVNEEPVKEPVLPTLGNPADLERLLKNEGQEESSHDVVWDKLRREHTRILAFDYEEGCEILTIKPQDIGLLPRDSWVYGNNSFLLHGFYNYRYLILAKLFNANGSPRYLLGVPGHYYSNEQYMASMFGFPSFVLSKEQPVEDGRFGFWYTDIKIGS
ncbi:hypothetical protein [Lacrimispora algidixylanolytica]|uniref:Uncharacterized protein n=1 Tax=Lacrimispora algidixylanolytica TaxID=94868 RepID=A0A419T5G9_9FIRM|nr:hypothetical protein [Lacrimispora algidixylanolytica]RKD32784.1 hypothetical protein BET01_16210 [Lacrimispora algidixylanolytica]